MQRCSSYISQSVLPLYQHEEVRRITSPPQHGWEASPSQGAQHEATIEETRRITTPPWMGC